MNRALSAGCSCTVWSKRPLSFSTCLLKTIRARSRPTPPV
jgi:hypothetical protein